MHSINWQIRYLGVVFALLVIFPFTAEPAGSKQTYKWRDGQGNMHYTDDPYEANRHGVDVILPNDLPAKNKKETKSRPGTTTLTTPATAGETNLPQQTEKGGGAVVLVGDLKFTSSASGTAVINAIIKNDGSSPVEGVRLDVILFHLERKRAADLFIKFTGGKIKPDRLDPGETGVIEYETNVNPEEIAGHRYRLVWDVYKNIVKPGKKMEQATAPIAPPPVPAKTKITKKSEPEIKKSRTRLKIEAMRKLRRKQAEESE